eukprot:506405-Rhodomonas_salina.3
MANHAPMMHQITLVTCSTIPKTSVPASAQHVTSLAPCRAPVPDSAQQVRRTCAYGGHLWKR